MMYFYLFVFPFIFDGQDKCKKRSNKKGKGVKGRRERPSEDGVDGRGKEVINHIHAKIFSFPSCLISEKS